MHSKSGELLNRFFPADMESVGRTLPAQLCRTDNERIAPSPENSADPLHTFGQPGRLVSAVIGHPVVDQVIGVRGFPIVLSFGWNKLNV